MNREYQTEILQKLSSTAVPPKGRTVRTMNEILDRELRGLVLDEERLTKPSGFICLIRRIFPHALDSLTPAHLNDAFRKLNFAEANVIDVPRASSSRITTRKKAALPKPAPRDQSRSAKKKSGPTSDIYDAKRKLWRWVDVVPRRVNKNINKVMEEYFSHPTPLAHEPGELYQETVGSTCTDVEDSGMSTEESSFVRKGAAYNGDSSRDQDYFCGNRKQKGGNPLVENQFSAFLNTLSATVLQHLNERDGTAGTDLRAVAAHRWWYGDFSVKKLDSVDDEPRWSRKPDLILLEGSQDGTPITWRSPRAIGEFTHSKLAANITLIKTLNTKAYLLLSSQPWRHYVLGLSFANFQMRIHFFDRSGAQISSPLNFHRDFQVVADIIHMFAHADRALLGYDPTIDMYCIPSIPKPVGSLSDFIGTVQGVGAEVFNIFELLWSSPGFIGRGTVCWHVRPEFAGSSKANEGFLDDYDYVLKDSWVDLSQVDHEPNILKHIAGIEGVPVLVGSWAVEFKEEEDTMLRYRPAGWIPQEPFVNRVHRRQLTHPVGSPITTFRSQKELLQGLIHGLESTHLITLLYLYLLTYISSCPSHRPQKCPSL